MYVRPTSSTLFELTEKKSRFLCHIIPCRTRQCADTALAKLQEKFSDARHCCWAMVLGDPQNPESIAWNDDGEPAGTAGKPILNVLHHKNIGDALAVVVRYFGGVKLGAGGLVRAYAGATNQAIELAVFEQVTLCKYLTVAVPYHLEGQVRHWLESEPGSIVTVRHSATVHFEVKLPAAIVTNFERWLSEVSGGQAVFIEIK